MVPPFQTELVFILTTSNYRGLGGSCVITIEGRPIFCILFCLDRIREKGEVQIFLGHFL